MEINKNHLSLVYIDCTKNDIPLDHSITELPQVRLYKPRSLQQQYVRYRGYFDAEQMEEFLFQQMGEKYVEPSLDL